MLDSVLTARDKYQREVAEALKDWRLGTIPPRFDDSASYIFREAMYDIIRFRLHIAYTPLLQGLERIEKRVAILSNLKQEPWAHPNHAVNQ